jgi:hypothetical protein
MSASEFVLPQALRSDRRTPLRWVLSHVRRQWWLLILLLIGALGNASLAAVVPVLVGRAFNVMLSATPDLRLVGTLALVIAGSQIGRGLLQLGRNFSAELSAQRVERDIRQELYLSLLGKSMTFHSLQPIGDTMARATNECAKHLLSPAELRSAQNFMTCWIVADCTRLWSDPGAVHPCLRFGRGAVPAAAQTGHRRARRSIEWRLAAPTAQVVRPQGGRRGRWLGKQASRASVRQGDIERALPRCAGAGSRAPARLLLYRQVARRRPGDRLVRLIQLFSFPTYVSLWAYCGLDGTGHSSSGTINRRPARSQPAQPAALARRDRVRDVLLHGAGPSWSR